MQMIVCIKQVIDPEADPSSFTIDHSNNKMVPQQEVSQVVDPYAEYAVEAALRIKDSVGGKIIAISLGENQLRKVVKKPLAMGVDELVLLEDKAFVDGDSWSTAYALSMAIKKIGNYDIIFCGREASDWNAGQVGSGIAELLGLPSVTQVQKIDIIDGRARVEKRTEEGFDLMDVQLPALITISHELGEPRYPSVQGIFAARKKEPIFWKPADIGVEISEIGAAGRRTELVKLFQPVREVKCKMAEGENIEEAAVDLALKLREAKVLISS